MEIIKKKIAILQPNYIPWKGYFDLINLVDAFVLLDNVQYTKRDWRNRNQLKTPQGLHWLSIPVRQVSQKQLIKDTQIISPKWIKQHWKTWKTYYQKAIFFPFYKDFLENLYQTCNYKYLGEINYHFIQAINQLLGIQTPIFWASDYKVSEDKNYRLIELVQLLDGNVYLSGPAAKTYLDEAAFWEANIEVMWMDYAHYPVYQQLYPPFRHEVSILDLLLHEGPKGRQFMKSFSNA